MTVWDSVWDSLGHSYTLRIGLWSILSQDYGDRSVLYLAGCFVSFGCTGICFAGYSKKFVIAPHTPFEIMGFRVQKYFYAIISKRDGAHISLYRAQIQVRV